MLGKKNSICLIQPSSQFVSEVPRNQSEKLKSWVTEVLLIQGRKHYSSLGRKKQNFFLALNSKASQNCTVDNTLSAISLANLLRNSHTDDI